MQQLPIEKSSSEWVILRKFPYGFIKMSEEQSSLFQRDYSFVIGNEDAKVQLVEFFDPACETCALFHPHVKEIMKKR